MNLSAGPCPSLASLAIFTSILAVAYGGNYATMPPPPPPPPPPTVPPPPPPPPLVGAASTAYYDSVVTEFSYKLWNSFMIISSIVLVFAIAECIYFTKVNYVAVPADYAYDYLQKRSVEDDRPFSFWTRSSLSADEADRIVDSVENLLDFDEYS